jgi:SEC-C motif-containing protein
MTSLQPPNSGPAALILARVEAFRRCDFGFIYDTYHLASNFRQQFPDREEYIRHGWANLGKEFHLLACRILKEAAEGSSARVIFWLEFELHGVRHGYAELAWLAETGEGWLYRCGQKLTAEELPVPKAQLDFCHFEQVTDKVVY